MNLTRWLIVCLIIGLLIAILFEINWVEYTLHRGLFNYEGTFTQFLIDSAKEIIGVV